jgi:hypothetical protein
MNELTIELKFLTDEIQFLNDKISNISNPKLIIDDKLEKYKHKMKILNAEIIEFEKIIDITRETEYSDEYYKLEKYLNHKLLIDKHVAIFEDTQIEIDLLNISIKNMKNKIIILKNDNTNCEKYDYLLNLKEEIEDLKDEMEELKKEMTKSNKLQKQIKQMKLQNESYESYESIVEIEKYMHELDDKLEKIDELKLMYHSMIVLQKNIEVLKTVKND